MNKPSHLVSIWYFHGVLLLFLTKFNIQYVCDKNFNQLPIYDKTHLSVKSLKLFM